MRGDKNLTTRTQLEETRREKGTKRLSKRGERTPPEKSKDGPKEYMRRGDERGQVPERAGGHLKK